MLDRQNELALERRVVQSYREEACKRVEQYEVHR